MFDAYGLRAGSNTTTDPYSYFGGQWGYYTDSETGLQLLTHRYYDPATGRFVTRDPIGYSGGLNLYAYALENPIMGIDPSGFMPAQSPWDSGSHDTRFNPTHDPSLEIVSDEGDPDELQLYRLKVAIQIIRTSGFKNAKKIADGLKYMLNHGLIKIDIDEEGTNAKSDWGILTTSYNGKIHLSPKLFEQNEYYYTHTDTVKWIYDADLSVTLVHEYQHARCQGYPYMLFHPYEREDKAYSASLRYIQALRASHPKLTRLINDLFSSHIVPSNKR